MFETLGIVFGGASRLVQHWMDTRDKVAEREHDLEVLKTKLSASADSEKLASVVKDNEIDSATAQAEITLTRDATTSQAMVAIAAGGWAASLSATVRPVTSYWLLVIYSASKAAALYLALQHGAQFAEAVKAAYTEFDGALLGSIISYWFADRSLRKASS